MFYTYILKSKNNNSYYVGSCKNVYKRLSLHNALMVRSTKRYAPWELVHTETYENLKLARFRELQIKSWKKRQKIEELIKTFENHNRGSATV